MTDMNPFVVSSQCLMPLSDNQVQVVSLCNSLCEQSCRNEVEAVLTLQRRFRPKLGVMALEFILSWSPVEDLQEVHCCKRGYI